MASTRVFALCYRGDGLDGGLEIDEQAGKEGQHNQCSTIWNDNGNIHWLLPCSVTFWDVSDIPDGSCAFGVCLKRAVLFCRRWQLDIFRQDKARRIFCIDQLGDTVFSVCQPAARGLVDVGNNDRHWDPG